jgi:hypothetical protein
MFTYKKNSIVGSYRFYTWPRRVIFTHSQYHKSDTGFNSSSNILIGAAGINVAGNFCGSSSA